MIKQNIIAICDVCGAEAHNQGHEPKGWLTVVVSIILGSGFCVDDRSLDRQFLICPSCQAEKFAVVFKDDPKLAWVQVNSAHHNDTMHGLADICKGVFSWLFK